MGSVMKVSRGFLRMVVRVLRGFLQIWFYSATVQDLGFAVRV